MTQGTGEMANLNRTRNKLLRNGFLPKEQSESCEIWMDVTGIGTDIEFGISTFCEVKGSFRVHGRQPDEPQHDLWYSSHTANLKEAIALSRI